MIAAMQQWFALFGIIPYWMSDQGPHYKNQVVEKLCRIYNLVLGASRLAFDAIFVQLVSIPICSSLTSRQAYLHRLLLLPLSASCLAV
jgi:hypothetical protein